MTLFPKPDYYLHNLITMTSSEATRLWRRAIKEQFGCTCVYCGESYDLSDLTIDHVHPRCRGGGDINNTVCACLQCNQDKGSNDWKDFIERYGNPLRKQLIADYIS